MAEDIPLPAFAATAGSRRPKLLLVGEAWGESEAVLREPFVGESGKELWRMLGEAIPLEPELHREASQLHRYGLSWVPARRAWLEAVGIGMTNVLSFRPPGNKLEALCCDRKELEPGYMLGPVSKGKYLKNEYLPELTRLGVELAEFAPNIVVALGNTACWALLRATNIGSIRGAVTAGHPAGPGADRKIIPSYHPAAVLRQWSWRPILVADLLKAWREAQFPEIRRPQRQVLINPSIEEVEAWTEETLAASPLWLAPDIETAFGQVRCIGFARSSSSAIVIPFLDKAWPGWSYWPEPWLERRAMDCVARLLSSAIPKIFQNGLYDAQYLLRLGYTISAMEEDTMLLHHSIYPEMQKGLGFLGSIYTSEMSWKLMARERPDSEKRDE